MPDLDAKDCCEAHKALVMCIKSIKKKQDERDHHLEFIEARLEAKLSTKLFLWAVLILLGFLGFNAVTNISLLQDVAVLKSQVETIGVTQKAIQNKIEQDTKK